MPHHLPTKPSSCVLLRPANRRTFRCKSTPTDGHEAGRQAAGEARPECGRAPTEPDVACRRNRNRWKDSLSAAKDRGNLLRQGLRHEVRCRTARCRGGRRHGSGGRDRLCKQDYRPCPDRAGRGKGRKVVEFCRDTRM